MRIFLVKHWFLTLLLGGLSVVLVWPEFVRPAVAWLDPRLVVAAALLLVAWGMETRQLLGSLRRPLPALWAVLISYGALPAVAWMAGRLIPNPDLRIGLLIAASVPCTLASSVIWTRLAGGNEATALLIVLLTTGLSWLATTTWLAVVTGADIQIDTAEMMRSLALVLVLPVGIGQLGRSTDGLRRLAAHLKPTLGVLSRVLIFTIILKAALDVRARLVEDRWTLTPAALLLSAMLAVGVHLLALFGGYWSGKGLRFDRADAIAVAFGCSQKTLPVALFLFDRYFREAYPLAVVGFVFYHVGQLIVDSLIADVLARRSARPANLAAETVI